MGAFFQDTPNFPLYMSILHITLLFLLILIIMYARKSVYDNWRTW